MCRKTGLDPKQMLDRFDADGPGRRMLPMPMKNALPYPLAVREKLDAARAYVHRPRWRRMFG